MLILKGTMTVLFCQITVPQVPSWGERTNPFILQQPASLFKLDTTAHLPFGKIWLFHVNDFMLQGT